MRALLNFVFIVTLAFLSSFAFGKENSVETLVFFRHGEKPETEIGLLNCQGFNRALKLPKVLTKKFGRPDYLFAPAPSKDTKKYGLFHAYTRPLATIEPTAIALSMPINSHTSESS